MKTRAAGRALTGLAAGALLSACLLGVLALGAALFGLPNVAFSVFEWLIRVLPGRLVVFGLETTLRILQGLGLDIKDTSKTVEEALALTGLFVTAALGGLLFFWLVGSQPARRVLRYGEAAGGVAGVVAIVIVRSQSVPTTLTMSIVNAAWVIGVFLLWGWGLARLYLAVYPPAEARSAPPAPAQHVQDDLPPVYAARMDRRHFVIRMGGLVATIIVLGAELAEILRVEGGPGRPARRQGADPLPQRRLAGEAGPRHEIRVHARG